MDSAPPAPVEEVPVPDESPVEQPPPVDPAAGGPVDPTVSGPGKSGLPHGPNEMAAFGQAQRSDHASPNAADPGTNGQGAGPKNGDAIPQPSNDGAPDLSVPPVIPPDSTVPADATDPTAAPGNSGNAGNPSPWAQGDPATPDPNGNAYAYGQAKQGLHGPGSAVAE